VQECAGRYKRRGKGMPGRPFWIGPPLWEKDPVSGWLALAACEGEAVQGIYPVRQNAQGRV